MVKQLFKTEPLPFQAIGIFRMQHRYHGRVLLADDMGLGKSLQSLYTAIPLRRKRPIIVVCPNSTKYSWEEEVKNHTFLQSWVLEGRKPPRRMPLYIPPVIILNWDIVWAWRHFLKKLGAKVFILDELHYAKNPKTQRAKAAKLITRDVPYIFGLTGTPFELRPIELYVGLNLIRPDVFKSPIKFGNRYCGPRMGYRGHTVYDGATRIPELRKLLRDTCMIRRKRSQVLKDLPPMRQQAVPLDIPRQEYERAERDVIAWLISKNRPTKKAKSALGLTRFGYLLRLVAEKKMKAVIEWIDNFLATTNRKLTVFGYHHDFLRPLYLHYKRQAVLVDGKVKGRKRQDAINEFVASKVKRLFFGNIIAAGTGINKLQHVCSDVAIAEFIWNPQKIGQAIARLHRMGQRRKVNAYFLIAKATVEYKLCKSLMKKSNIFDAIMNGRTDGSDFDVMADVVGEIKRTYSKKKAA